MKKIKSFFSKHFGITFLSRFLYAIFWILALVFLILAYQRISSINFKELTNFDQSYLEQTLVDELSRPFAIGAAALAFLTLGLTASRTARMDKQLEKMDQQIKTSQRQIQMVEKQHQASYQPTLIILQSQFNIQTGYTPTHKTQDGISQIVKSNPFLILHYESEKGNQPNIFIDNIGKGVATNIKYKFIYPINECMDMMKSYDAFNYFYISFDGNTVSILTKGSPQLAFEAYYSEEINEKFLDYILTIDNAQQPTKIVLPYFYTLLNFFKDEVGVYTNNKQKFNGIKIGDIFPKLQLEISYSDIGGQSYTKRFELNITAKFFVQLLDGTYQFNEGNYNYDIIPTELNQ